MLKKFSVENYKNLSNKIELSFDSVRSYTFNDQFIKNNLLNKVLIVGRNGCGKTNLGYALFDIVCTLTDNAKAPLQMDGNSFLCGDSNCGYATFEYVFQDGNHEYRYQYRKTAPDQIIYEQFEVDSECVFCRNGTNGHYEGLKKYGAEKLNINIPDGPLSVLRFIANNTMQKPHSPISFIMNFTNGMLFFKSDPEGNGFIGLHKNREILSDYIINNGLVKEFKGFLHEIAGLDVNLSTVHIPGKPEIMVERFNKNNLRFEDIASKGTKALMQFYYWYHHLNKVTFLYMDEFDLYYYHETAEKILKMVAKLDTFQTIFTSHNTALIGNSILRPDCYVLLDHGTLGTFPNLTGRELREGHNLEKMYREGEFSHDNQGNRQQ